MLSNTLFSGQEVFHNEEHAIRVEKLELDERLKREQWENVQAKIDKLEQKV